MGRMTTTRTAIVTGAARGIGRAIALRLATDGHHVAVLDLDESACQVVVDEITEGGGTALAVGVDVSDAEQVEAGVARVAEELGAPTLLVNNAGYGSYGALEEVPMDEARRQFEVNVFGLARLTQLITPHMRTRGSGTIINISSIGGRLTTPLGGWYHATKYAVEALSDALRMELRPFGIDVVVIEPGCIRTAWWAIAADHLEATAESSAGSRPGPGRRGRLEP